MLSQSDDYEDAEAINFNDVDELDNEPGGPIVIKEPLRRQVINTRSGRVVKMPRRYSYYETDLSQLFSDVEHEE